MFTGLIKKTYRNIVSQRARQKLWQLRQVGANSRRVKNRLRGRFTVRCHVCGGREISRYSNGIIAQIPYDFYRCQNCRFIFVYPPPDTSSFYGESTLIEMGGSEVSWNTSFLDALEKHAPNRGKLLEIGFGDADFLRLAHERGWEVHGAELSNNSVRHAQALGLPNIQYGTIEALSYPANHFDAIAAFNFIEHVPDPRTTLGELHRILQPGGLVVLLCPNMAGLYHELILDLFHDRDPLNISWVPPAHLSYFNRDNLKRLLESCGFELVSDESERTPALWLQHEVTIGPETTRKALNEALATIQNSQPGDPEIEKSREQTKQLLIQRMTWALVTDLMQIEATLGSECAILYVARKVHPPKR